MFAMWRAWARRETGNGGAVAQTSFQIESVSESEQGRLKLKGELDLASTGRVEQAVDALLAEGVRALLLDLGDVSFVDSSGLRLFIVLDQRARAESWKLTLTRPQPQAMTVFVVSGLEENLPFTESSGVA
jgi:anti-anti-sigma factor